MTDKKKHIDLFEELIRILSLKKRFNPESMENFVAPVDRSYMPDKGKTEKLFNELEAYYKSQKPGRKYPIILWVIPLLIIPIGIIFLNQKKQVERQSERPMLDTIQIKSDKNDILLDEKVVKVDSPIKENKSTSEIILPAINTINTFDLELQKHRNQALLNDTTLERITIPDTSPEEDTETFLFYVDKYCNLPEKYIFLFSKKSTEINEPYKNDLMELAIKIKNCPNIGTIDIKAFYTSKFIFFSNKKIVSERIDNTLKNLKRNGVTIKMLRDKKIEFIRVPKDEYNESFEKVEISLNN